jgi:tetratricopeptide (TPR) repeat protein
LGFQRAALAVRPNESYANANVAGFLHNMGRWTEAEHGYKAAIRLDPTNHWAHSNLAGMLLRQDRFVEAEKHLRKAIQLAPHTPHFYLLLRSALHGQGKRADGDAACLDLLQYADRLTSWGRKDLKRKVVRGLADSTSDSSNRTLALEFAKKLVELSPDDAALRDILSRACTASGNEEAAVYFSDPPPADASVEYWKARGTWHRD